MPYVTPKQIQTAKRMDLLTHLKNNNPEELVYVSGDTYCTKTHDSLRISNGKWCWFSQGIGGKSALDYLIKVEGYKFTEAVEVLTGLNKNIVPVKVQDKKEKVPAQKKLMLPPKNADNYKVIKYLKFRGLDIEIINYCIRNKLIYEEEKHHNAVLIGYDSGGVPRYGALRGITGYKFLGEVPGSDKHFSFFVPPKEKSDTVHIFESAIDLLSFATLIKISGKDWRGENLLSLAGVYSPKKNGESMNIPKALEQFLKTNNHVKKINLHLDNDEIGRIATKALIERLKNKYLVTDQPPKYGKDVNDTLRTILKGKIKTREDER